MSNTREQIITILAVIHDIRRPSPVGSPIELTFCAVPNVASLCHGSILSPSFISCGLLLFEYVRDSCVHPLLVAIFCFATLGGPLNSPSRKRIGSFAVGVDEYIKNKEREVLKQMVADGAGEFSFLAWESEIEAGWCV